MTPPVMHAPGHGARPHGAPAASVRRRRRALFAGIAALAALAVPSAANADEAVPVTFWVTGGEATVTGPSATFAGTDLEVPATVSDGSGTYPVTAIGSGALDRLALRSVSLPDSVRYIHGNAFEGNPLSTVRWPAGLRSVGTRAFQNTWLTEVTLPEGTRTVAAEAFDNTRLASVTLPDSLGSVGARAFRGGAITQLRLPAGLTSIDDGAFEDNAITEVNLSEELLSIGAGAFRDNLITEVETPAGLGTIGHSAFRGNPLEDVTVNGAPDIAGGAFAGTDGSLTGVTLTGRAPQQVQPADTDDAHGPSFANEDGAGGLAGPVPTVRYPLSQQAWRDLPFGFTTPTWKGYPSQADASLPSQTVPGAPANAVFNHADRDVTITWEPPADTGGSPITGYRVVLSAGTTMLDPSEGVTLARTLPADATSTTFEGLSVGEYGATIRAINARGMSRVITRSGHVRYVAPLAPDTPSLSAAGDDLTVTWVPSPDTAGWWMTGPESSWGLSGFRVLLTPRTGDPWVAEVTGQNAVPVTFDDVTPGAYRATVISRNRYGDSPASSPSAEVIVSGTSAVEVEPLSLTDGEAATLYAYVTGGATDGSVTARVGALELPGEVDGGEVRLAVPAGSLPVGEHTVTVRFAGTDVYAPSEGTGTITVLAAPAPDPEPSGQQPADGSTPTVTSGGTAPTVDGAQQPTASTRPKARATVTVSTARTVRRGTAARLVVRVRAAGVRPTGRVTVRVAGLPARTATLRNGVATVRIPVARTARPGSRKVTVTYLGSASVRAARITGTAIAIRR